MIYLNENSGCISIPRHTFSDGYYTLVLTSNLTNEIILVDDKENISTNDSYYKFEITTDELTPGEYTYELYNNEVVIELGLITFGSYEKSRVEYDTFNPFKVQYNG